MDDNSKSIMGKIKEMQPGETIAISIDVVKYSTLRHYACLLSVQNDMNLSTHLEKSTRMCEITRHE